MSPIQDTFNMNTQEIGIQQTEPKRQVRWLSVRAGADCNKTVLVSSLRPVSYSRLSVLDGLSLVITVIKPVARSRY